MINQKGNHIRFLITLLLLFFGVSIEAQEINKDSVRNQRMSVSSGGWLSGGINTSRISVGQNGVSSLLNVTAGETEYTGNFGFIIPLIEEIEPNNPPIGITPQTSILYELGDELVLNGFDPDGNAIEFVVVEQPKNGELTSSSLSSNKFEYTPNRLLTPQTGYRDTLKFKVVEVNGEKLESEIATLPFTFNIEDEAHEVSGLSITEADQSSKSLKLEITDPKVNNSYGIIFQYLDLSNPLSPVLVELVNDSYALSSFEIGENTLSVNLNVSREEHPFMFSAEQVFLTINVTTPTGFSDDDAFILTNDISGNTNGSIKEVSDGNSNSLVTKKSFESNTSTDGQFFNFASERQTPENTAVALNLYAAELGDFDLTLSTISISEGPKNGTITDPILVKSTANISQWTLFYQPQGEIGYLDSLEFSVTNPARDLTVSAYAKVEVIGVNDAPSLSAIADQLLNEEESKTIDLSFSDLDSELNVTVTSSDATNVPVSINGNTLSINQVVDFNGNASITVLVEEEGTTELYSKFETFDVEIAPVNDQPVMVLIDDQAIDEDNVFTYTLAATDVDATVPLFTYTVTPDIPGVATVSTNGNSLSVTPNNNYSGTVTFSVTADDRLGTNTSISEVETFKLVVNPVNDAPISTASIPAQNVVDVQPAYVMDLGEYFEDIETSDAELVITESSSGNLFTFAIENDNLTVTPIQGQTGTEDVVFNVSDGEFSVEQTVTFSIKANSSDITAIAIDDLSLQEDFVSTTIDLSSVFTDTGDANAVFSYTVGGLNSLSAEIVGTNLVISSSENYNGNESVFLIASANNKSSFTTFDVNVSAVNDAPTLSALDAQNIQEDGVLSDLFMSFTDIDTDLNNLTFTATSSDESIIEASAISLSESQSGVLISANTIVNASGQVTITININDGEFDVKQDFLVNVSSVNDAPMVVSTSVASATEDSEYTEAITGLFTDVDEDELSYTLDNNPDWLSIENGNLKGQPDNNDVGSIEFFITADDGNGGSVRQGYSLTVVNINDAPVLSSPISDIEVSEDNLLSSLVDISSFTDVDGDALTLSAAFTGADWLSFSPTTNRFTGTPSNNDVGTVEIVVTATDPSGATVSDNVLLTVVNTNDTPTELSLSANSINENIALGTTLGTLSTTDVDAGDSFTYSFVEGSSSTNNDLFTINGDELVTNATINFEANETLNVIIQTTDGAGASLAKSFSITVNNINEAPTDISSSGLTIAENAGSSAEVGTLSTTDPDADDSFTLSLTSGTGDTNNDSFQITDGKLVAKNSFNFEITNSYSVRVKTEDAGGLSYEEALTIAVTNVNEAPSDISITSSTIDENQPVGTLIGSLSSTDEDEGDTFTYSLKAGVDDNDSFGIDAAGLITASEIDFETNSTYTLLLTSTDASGASFDKALTLNVNNVDEPSIANIEGLVFDLIDIAETATQTFTVDNNGDTDIEVTSIVLPDGYAADMTSFTVAVGSTSDVVVTFTPSEARVYAGEIVMQSTVGETRISITGEATIVTAIDDEVLDEDEVKLYPNPAQNYVTIDLSEIPQSQPNLTIVNMNGKSVWQMNNVRVPKVRVDVGNYPAGSYLVRVSSEKGTVVKKLLIIK
ncbi:tandem-95 repeat protein [Roseivirga sp.]|uniref:tandem-95 repeat protein n=1 Tax=Roseivirga sp. TaxID=1964215 RepID=UPI003B8B1B11